MDTDIKTPNITTTDISPTTTTTTTTTTTAATTDIDIDTDTNTETTAATASRHYFYRKATQPDRNNNTVFLNVAESSDDFESRVTNFIQKDMLQQTLSRLRQDATTDLNRRKADRKARKEKERNNNSIEGAVVVAESRVEKPHRHQEERTGPLFEKLSTLNPTEQNQWLSNIHDDAMLMNPHQWLKLANLFNVNSKASRQKTLISIKGHFDVLKDRSIDKDDNLVSLESYMELRDVQNRNYARDAVAEGVKYIKQNRIKEAMDYYKRALDMDPKYADGWFHVAEGLVQQRKLQEAAVQLERALKLEPEHEGAKSLLASIRYTTQTKKPEKGDEWDLVDETGHGLSSSPAVAKTTSSSSTKLDNEDKDKPSSKKKKKISSLSSSHRRSSHHRSSRRSSRSPVSRESRNRSRESRHRRDYDDRHRESRKSSLDNSSSRRHRRSNRSRSKDSERISRHDDNNNNANDSDKHKSRHRRRDDSGPRESRRHRSRISSRERESRHSNSKSEKSRHRSKSRSPSKQIKRKRSDDDNGDDGSYKSQKE